MHAPIFCCDIYDFKVEICVKRQNDLTTEMGVIDWWYFARLEFKKRFEVTSYFKTVPITQSMPMFSKGNACTTGQVYICLIYPRTTSTAVIQNVPRVIHKVRVLLFFLLWFCSGQVTPPFMVITLALGQLHNYVTAIGSFVIGLFLNYMGKKTYTANYVCLWLETVKTTSLKHEYVCAWIAGYMYNLHLPVYSCARN